MKIKSFVFVLLLLLSGVDTWAQILQVAGKVTGARREALAGVQITIQGTSRGTKTTDQGLYIIELNEGQALEFALRGYSRRIVVPTGRTLDVQLSLDSLRHTTPTDSTATAPAEEMTLSTGSRGATSILGSAKPLWVLNGVILGSDYGSIEDFIGANAKQVVAAKVPGLSIDNIERVRILTSSTETSAYGPRGIAGVIEITSKQGSGGSQSLNYSGEFTWRPIPSYNNINIMNSQQHVSLIQDMVDAGLFPIHEMGTKKDLGLIGQMYELFGKTDASGTPLLTNDVASRAAFLRAAERRNTDWFKELYQNSIIHQHTLSFNGGTSKTNFFASLTARVDPGWTIADKANTYSGNISADYRLLQNVRVGLKLIGEYATSEESGESPVKYAATTSRALAPRDSYTRDYVPFNIFDELRANRKNKTQQYLSIQGSIVWDVLKQLKASFVTDLKYTNTVTFADNTEQSILARSMRAMQSTYIRSNNKNLYTDPDNPFALPMSILPEGGIRENKLRQRFLTSYKLNLDYHETFGRHQLRALGEIGVDVGSTETNTNLNYGVLFDLGGQAYFIPEAFKRLYEKGSNYYTIQNGVDNNVDFLTQVSYSYDERYSLVGLLRFDASNKFGPSRYIRWLPTWNVELGWAVHKEAFFPSLRPLSSLSLKVSYGLVADNPSVSNSLERIYADLPWRPNSKEIGLTIKNLANHGLTYEKTRTLSFVASASAFKNRISATVDWYTRRSYDLVGPIYTQGVGGEVDKRGNVAELSSSGLQLQLMSTNIRTKTFTWQTGFSYLHKTNRITKLLTSPTVKTMTDISGFSYQGYPLSSVFSIPFLGLTDRGMPRLLNDRGVETLGDFNFQSTDVSSLRYSGTLVPTDLGSLTNILRYGGLALSINLSYQFGAVTRRRYITPMDDIRALPRDLVDRWVRPGDEAKTNIPRIPSNYAYQEYGRDNITNAYTAYNLSDARTAKTDFVRLKEVSLEYTFARQFLRRTPVRSLSLKLQAQNLMLLYSDSRLRGDDPEYMYLSSMVPPKQLILTLRVGL
nr:SusC/RagA family protein [uncultured Porphyromonas sp.]